MILEADSTLTIHPGRRSFAVRLFLFDLKLSITYRWDQAEIVAARTESREEIESLRTCGNEYE